MSRLESIEKSRLIKQSIAFFAGGIAVWLVFIFALLPIFSKILAMISKKSFLPESTPAPIVLPPTLEQPFEATNSAQIKLKGMAIPSTTIILGQNGALDLKTKADDKGSFTFENVTLLSGENMFQAYAEDSSGARSDGSAQVTITLMTDAPKLEVSEPSDGVVVTQRKQRVISVKGTTDPGNKVYLNSQFLFVASDGKFQGSFQLAEGDNVLAVKAVNKAGNELVKEIHAKYAP